MLKDAPDSVRAPFWKHALLYGAIVMFGLIWSMITKDADLMLLTVAITALGLWRVVSLRRIICQRRYRVVEGIVIDDAKRPLSNSHYVTLQLEDGSQIIEIVAGRRFLKPMETYRLYLYSSIDPGVAATLPDAVRPAQTMLGCEELSHHR